MAYIDVFVLPIAAEQVETYRKLAKHSGKIWLEHGALAYRECVLEDANAFDMVGFPKLAKVKEGETVVVAHIDYKSRKHRDQVNAKVMADPRIEALSKNGVPFNMKRMAYGGFVSIVDL
jgi:uncharacterized protein YbaA (DUF1428 family)